MQKLSGESMDIVAENIAKLREIFPDVFTEGRVDFEALEATLGEYVEGAEERYSFNWNGKAAARRIAQTPSTGTLRPAPEESKDWDTTENLYIEGDNLEVLKLLQKSYHKQVKMIYIDPPYNTGKDFVYRDNFRDNLKNYLELTGQVDSEGRKLATNAETSGRYHSDWLNMMYPRLKLARNLLKDDGVIFISIDDNEVANLRKICDEIFGEENFVANVIWQRAFSPKNDAKFLSENHDYILIYTKNIDLFDVGRLPRSEEANSRFKNIDNDPRGSWTSGDLSVKTYSEKYDYPIETPSGRIVNPPHGACWRVSKEKFQELVEDNRIWFGTDGGNVPRLKRFLSEVQNGMVATTLWMHQEVGHNQEGRQEVKALFDDKGYFDGPKPVRLLHRVLHIANTNPDDLILDFFSGSATTAHAVMQLNAEDSGKRRHILVQLPESTDEKSEAYKAGYKNICEIGKERIRRAGEKIKEENAEKEGIENLDIGFKVFKLDSSNIKAWDPNSIKLKNILDYKQDGMIDYKKYTKILRESGEFNVDNMEDNEIVTKVLEYYLEEHIENIKPDRTEADLLYEILLKYGLDLTLPIEELSLADKKVYVVGLGSLVICLDREITLDTVEEIAKLKEKYGADDLMRVVFRDNGFKDAEVKTNAIQILKQFGIDDVKSL